jgi:hypothetical protein
MMVLQLDLVYSKVESSRSISEVLVRLVARRIFFVGLVERLAAVVLTGNLLRKLPILNWKYYISDSKYDLFDVPRRQLHVVDLLSVEHYPPL